MSAPDCRHCGLPTPDEWPDLCRWHPPPGVIGADRPCELDRWDEADWLADQRDAAKAKRFADRLASVKVWICLLIGFGLILLGWLA